MNSHSEELHSNHGSLKSKLFITVMLFLTFIWTGSVAWLALPITLLITGYAYLSRREVDWQWVALPAAFNGYWVLTLLL